MGFFHHWINKIASIYLNSSLHISFMVGMFGAYSYLILGMPINCDYIGFISCSTLFIYSLHRLVGMDKVGKFRFQGRFAEIRSVRPLIIGLGIGGMAFIWYFLLRLPYAIFLVLVSPGIISFLYVLPVFGKARKRLRDLPLIKIFLIAIVYAYIIGFVPGIENHSELEQLMYLFMSRFFFVLAITIPFDIRDLKVDKETEVITLVSQLGILKSKSLAIGFVLLSLAFIFILIVRGGLLSTPFLLTELIVHAFTICLILYTTQDRKDYYFSGLIDGTMGMFYLVYILCL